MLRNAAAQGAMLAAALVIAPLAQAGVLATELLPMPLAPEMESSTQLHLPDAFDPKQPTWVSYKLIAVSPTKDPEGQVVVTGMFEREPTSPTAGTVLFEPRDLRVTQSAGTIQQQFEQNFGKRSESGLRAIWGDAMYDAYVAVNAGTGRMLDGTAVRELPPLSQGDPILLVSVENAKGIQPAGLLITVGQGEIPAAHQPNVESTGAFKLGLGLGKMLPILLLLGIGYVVYRVIQSRREG
ncbi:hypothetical protein [Silanimonas sp.]|uniref:hypothetical protein n=1 Tax=Silanimonas sp. TaxID=1929290 RepID=UPI0022C25C15|nr:hypothetical protein [Silanimonas sp.]MCZ8164801.1 hypothetical protein [Silanimonas sp.]